MRTVRWELLASAAVVLCGSAASAQCFDLQVTRTDDAPREPSLGPAQTAVCQAVGGGCTLRAALQTADVHAGCDRIVLGPNTYSVTRPRTAAPSNLATLERNQWRFRGDVGALTLRSLAIEDTILDGRGAVIEARGNLDRVFQVSTRSPAFAAPLPARGLITIRDVTFRGGHARRNVDFGQPLNLAERGPPEAGGGVELSTCFDRPVGPEPEDPGVTYTRSDICKLPHDVHLINVVIENNQSDTTAGGLSVNPMSYPTWSFLTSGFAGNVVLMNVVVRGNRAAGNAGGIENYPTWCSSMVVGAGGLVVQGNAAGQNGGGVVIGADVLLPGWHQYTSDAQVCPETAANTPSRYRGAPRFRENVDVMAFFSNRARNGGGLYANPWSFNLAYARFEGNEALENGGAIAVEGSLYMNSSGFTANVAGLRGGALFAPNNNSGTASVEGTSFIRNHAGLEGGAIWLLHNPPADLSDVRGFFSYLSMIENTAGERGGGFFVGPSSEDMNVGRSTLADNRVLSALGQGDNVFQANPVPRLRFRSSLFRQAAQNLATRPDSCFGPLASLGQNLDDSNTCAQGAADLRSRDPKLARLTGGLSDGGVDVYGRQGLVPQPGSPAIDGALASLAKYWGYDGLGRAAVLDGDRDGVLRHDIGSVEAQSTACASAVDCSAFGGSAAANTLRTAWSNLLCSGGFCRGCTAFNQASAVSCPAQRPHCGATGFCSECLAATQCATSPAGRTCFTVDPTGASIPGVCGCAADGDCGGPGRICDSATRSCVDGCRLPTVGCPSPSMCLTPVGGGAGQCRRSCSSDTDCATGRCRQAAPRFCVECESSAECATDAGSARCDANRCVLGCATDIDCPATHHCDGTRAACVTDYPVIWPDGGQAGGAGGGGTATGGGGAATGGGGEERGGGAGGGQGGGGESGGGTSGGTVAGGAGGVSAGGGSAGGDSPSSHCGCGASSAASWGWLSALALWPRRRRRVLWGAAPLVALALLACDGRVRGPKPGMTGGGRGDATGGGTAGGASGGGESGGGGGQAGAGGGDEPQIPGDEPAVELRRLTQAQVRHALADVFGSRFVPNLPLDGDEVSYGSTAIGSAHAVTGPLAAEQYFRFYSELTHAVFLDATRRQALLGESCALVEANLPCVRSFLDGLARKLWRRPATAQELNRLVLVIAEVANATGRDLWKGLEQAVTAMLVSPYFGYRVEVGEPMTARPWVRAYTGWEMAQRLSFTLWNSVPDDALLAAAAAGELSTPAQVRAQALRMLADAKGRRGLVSFLSEQFELGALDSFARDPELFPNLPQSLPQSMREEALRTLEAAAFLEGPYRQGRFLDLLDSRTTYVNGDLVGLYRLPVQAGADAGFVEARLDPNGPRAGIFGTAAFLASTSKTQRTSPTLRGRFIRERMLCETVANPPADVNAMFPTPDGGETFVNMAQRLQEHSVNPACAGCHRMMDPLGLGLERFDAIGAQLDAGHPAVLWPDGGRVMGHIDDPGTAFDTPAALGGLLKQDPRVPRCVLRQSLRWVLGRREATAADVAIIDALTERLITQGDLRELVAELMASEAFRTVPNRHTEGAGTCAP